MVYDAYCKMKNKFILIMLHQNILDIEMILHTGTENPLYHFFNSKHTCCFCEIIKRKLSRDITSTSLKV